jgi:hypothetical protein
MNFKQLQQHAETCEVEADKMAYTLVKERQKQQILTVLQNYCDFNVHHTIGLLAWNQPAVYFIIQNGKDLKRKFSLDELVR